MHLRANVVVDSLTNGCRLQLRKEADENIDTVAAYTLQVKEIVESYVRPLKPCF